MDPAGRPRGLLMRLGWARGPGIAARFLSPMLRRCDYYIVSNRPPLVSRVSYSDQAFLHNVVRVTK
ncbi:hypothetical protein ACFPRL_06190 [Pseudoclavibacter helvolus]